MPEEINKKRQARRFFLRQTLSLIPMSILMPVIVSAKASLPADKTQKILDYIPTFFNAIEWAFIISAIDQLIPDDDNGPGGVYERVPQFIDKQMETPYGWGHLWYMHPPFEDGIPEMGYQSHLVPRDIYREGIKMIDQYCHDEYGTYFSHLSAPKKSQIMKDLEQNKISNNSISGQLFFNQLLDNAHEGFLSDPIHGGNRTMASWHLIGFPGSRADYLDTVNSPGKVYPYGPVGIARKQSTQNEQ